MNSKSSWQGLRGASKKETTREEVLAQAKAERAARSEARLKNKAATVIQSHWRSYAARVALQQQLLQQWQASYASAAAQPDVILPAAELQQGAVRLLLMALLPFGSIKTKAQLHSGAPLHLDTAASTAAVKGTVALVLRSITSSSEELNYMSSQAQQDAKGLSAQAVQLGLLCCLLVAGDSKADSLLMDAAATRLLQLMTDTSSPAAVVTTANSNGVTAGADYTSPVQSDTGGDTLMQSIVVGLQQQPMPLLRAVRRLVLLRCKQQQQQQPVGSPVSAAGVLDANGITAAGLQRLLHIALVSLTLKHHTCDTTQQQQQQRQHYAEQFTLVVVTAPGLAAVMPSTVKSMLFKHHILEEVLLPTARQLAAAGRLSGFTALHCLVNLVLLCTGCDAASSKQQQQQQQQQQIASSPFLEDPAAAVSYCSTAIQLLSASTSQAAQNSSSRNRLACSGRDVQQTSCQGVASSDAVLTAHEVGDHCGLELNESCSMLGTSGHLLQLLRVLSSCYDDGVVVWCAYCMHIMHNSSRAAATAGSSSEHQSSSNSSGSGLSQAVLNVLSFAPNVLLSLWRWLAVTAGFPVEAAVQASRGLDIAAVAGGPEGLRPGVVLVLGLFCRSVAQLLLVLSDADLHQHQTPFSIGTNRAIATTLNSLVFHTAFPQTGKQIEQQRQQQQLPGRQQRQQQQGQTTGMQLLPSTSAYGMALLRQYAPVVLHGYFERDARQRFCQPNLWTEPYNNLMAAVEAQQQQQQQQQSGGALVTSAAVVQALLAGTGLTGTQEPGSSSRWSAAGDSASMPPAVAAAGSSAMSPGVAGLRTSSLLSLLRSAPQCVPFPVRLELFRQMLQQDKSRGCWCLPAAEGGPRPIKLTVRREVLLEDTYRALAGVGQAIKGRLYVTFVSSQGVAEAGLDHGGLMKELLEQVVALGTQPEYGLFTATEDSGLMYPNPAAEAISDGLGLLEFIGMMIGKALYDGILLNLAFAPFLLRSLQGGRATFDDLAGLDSTLHANLVAVKACPADQVEHLGLTFSAEQHLFGKTVHTDLIPGGDQVAVTADNRLMYVHLMADYHLNTRLGRAAAAFARGLGVVLPPSWLRLFSPEEFNQLISGGKEGGLDVQDMARYTKYSNGYNESSHTVKMFWRVVEEFSPQQRSALLRFITSTSRAPLGGFKHLQPPLTIHKVECGGSALAVIGVGRDVDRLPSASTCYNMLKLPNYKKRSTLKEKLLYAIQSNAGFELS